MKIIKTVNKLKQEVKRLSFDKSSIGFVPTMGALHDGHLSLIKQARKENKAVVVSIFVNPAQFGPKEDYQKYPRDINKDSALCRKSGVDVIFNPSPKEMYPEGYSTYIDVEGLSLALCGAKRPGHFRGVATVVTKLFNLVTPDKAYFGQKDAQQAAIIKKLVRDLNIPVQIRVMPTVREKDGLALSSRNAYLSEKEREDAAALFKALKTASKLIKNGLNDTVTVTNKMAEVIKQKKTACIEYISIVEPKSLRPLKKIEGKCLIALAVRIGNTRLIDNIIVNG